MEPLQNAAPFSTGRFPCQLVTEEFFRQDVPLLQLMRFRFVAEVALEKKRVMMFLCFHKGMGGNH